MSASVREERSRAQLASSPRGDDPAEVHDRDGVGDVAHDREVVRDQEETELELAGELDEEVRDPARTRRARPAARRGRSPTGPARAPGRSRCAAAVRPRTHADSRAPHLPEVRPAPGAPPPARRFAREATPRTASAPPIWSPTRRRGLSDENGFWNTIWRRASSGGARRVSGRFPPLEPDRPGDGYHADGGTGERRLAASRLADEADDLAASDGEARAGDGTDGADPRRSLDDDLVQREAATRSSAQGVDGAGERPSVHRNERRNGGPALLQRVGAARRNAHGRCAAARGSPETATSESRTPPDAGARRGGRACTWRGRPRTSAREPASTTRPA